MGSYLVDPKVKSLSGDEKPLLKPSPGEPILYAIGLGGDGKSVNFIKPVVETRSDGEQAKIKNKHTTTVSRLPKRELL